MTWIRCVLASLLLLLPTACASGQKADVARLRWSACGEDANWVVAGPSASRRAHLTLECAELRVPLSYDDPQSISLGVAVVRVRHDQQHNRIGSLILNPGGPAASGVDYLPGWASWFPDALLERFDLVTFDPRGTGLSDPIDCPDELSSGPWPDVATSAGFEDWRGGWLMTTPHVPSTWVRLPVPMAPTTWHTILTSFGSPLAMIASPTWVGPTALGSVPTTPIYFQARCARWCWTRRQRRFRRPPPSSMPRSRASRPRSTTTQPRARSDRPAAGCAIQSRCWIACGNAQGRVASQAGDRPAMNRPTKTSSSVPCLASSPPHRRGLTSILPSPRRTGAIPGLSTTWSTP